MNIGIDARFYGTPGKGLGRYTQKLIEELEKLPSKHTYHIFLSPEGYALYRPAHSRFIKHQVPFRWYGISEQLFYPWVLLRQRLDLMHFPHFNVPLLYRRPFVVTVHDLILFHFPTRRASTRQAAWYWLKYWAYKRVIHSALKRARSVITVSRFTRDDLLTVYPFVRDKIHVTLEGVERSCFWQPPEAHRQTLKQLVGVEDEPFLLYVGNAYPHKNLELLVDIAGELVPQRIAFVGRQDYFYEALQKKVVEKKLSNIIFVGGVDDRELASLYRGASLYLFPSLYEGFGLPPLEAMLHGTPVIASNRGSLPEILGDAAWLIDPHPANFLESIRRALNESDVLTKLVEKGFVRIQEYSWHTLARQTESIYTLDR